MKSPVLKRFVSLFMGSHFDHFLIEISALYMISTRISIFYNAKKYYIEGNSEGNILYYIKLRNKCIFWQKVFKRKINIFLNPLLLEHCT